MNPYARDLSLLDLSYGFSDSVGEPLNQGFFAPASLYHEEDDDFRPRIHYPDKHNLEPSANRSSPPKHRHDGKSPLPLGMDWSAPPRKWEGRNTVWPHDPQTGWSYCVTIPSWMRIPKSRTSNPAVFYRIQVGLQSPEGLSADRVILRRFSNFVELFASIKKEFPKKNLPQAPPKKILRINTQSLLEERRRFLEDWMDKLLSDIDVSRSASVATFLELEAAVRSYFNDVVDQQNEDANLFSAHDITSFLHNTGPGSSLFPGSLSDTSEHANDSFDEISELGTPGHQKDVSKDFVRENSTSEENVTDWHELITKYGLLGKNIQEKLERLSMNKTDIGAETSNINGENASEEVEYQRFDGSVGKFPMKNVENVTGILQGADSSNLGLSNLFRDGSKDLAEGHDPFGTLDDTMGSDIMFPRDQVIACHLEERNRLKRVIETMKQRVETAKADMEDLVARLYQEVAVREFLSTKVKDLEVEVETNSENCKQSMEQAVLSEKERYTQMQWDIEELRKQCMEMELSLKTLEDENKHFVSEKTSLLQENKMLLEELDSLKEKLENLHKTHQELETKSKADLKVLIKEVKSLRTSQSELKQELSRLMREKLEMERGLQRENKRAKESRTANEKLLQECDILRNRLQECSVGFNVEQDNKLIVDPSSLSDVADILSTSDNRIGLLLAEAQLLAQDVEKLTEASEENDETTSSHRKDVEVRKMLTDILIDNARLRMQMNSLLRCALPEKDSSENDAEEEEEEKEEVPLRGTVLSNFLEK